MSLLVVDVGPICDRIGLIDISTCLFIFSFLGEHANPNFIIILTIVHYLNNYLPASTWQTFQTMHLIANIIMIDASDGSCHYIEMADVRAMHIEVKNELLDMLLLSFCSWTTLVQSFFTKGCNLLAVGLLEQH